MSRFLFCVLVGLAAAFRVGAGQGGECEGVSFPEQVEIEGETLKLNGLGLRHATFLKVDVYVAALYVAQASNQVDAISANTTRS